MQPRHRRYRRGRPLRWGAQNARALTAPGKAREFAKSWGQRYDVVLILDTKANAATATTIAREMPGWTLYWAHNTGEEGEQPVQQQQPPPTPLRPTTSQAEADHPEQAAQHAANATACEAQPSAPHPTPDHPPSPHAPRQHSRVRLALRRQRLATGRPRRRNAMPAQVAANPRRSAGVAIAIRTQLLAQGVAKVGQVSPSPDGRLLTLRLDWAGHSLLVSCIYMPNEPAAQRTFIQERLGPLARQATTARQLWGGDFNFVEDILLDRCTSRASHSEERRVAATWREHVPPASMVDIFRKRHPSTVAYSHHHPRGAARLDRFYISTPLEPWVTSTGIGGQVPDPLGDYYSDHRPATLQLLPANPRMAPAPPTRRVRMLFAGNMQLLQLFRDKMAELQAAAPIDPHALLAWWPSFKRRMAGECKALNKAARALRLPNSTASAQQLSSLYERVQREGMAAIPELLQQRRRHAATTSAELADASMAQRRRYLHNGERPSPVLTAQLKPPTAAKGVPALRSRSGRLATSPASCAQLTAKYWASVSAQPTTDPAAQQEVLFHLPTGEPLRAAAQKLGATEVSMREVSRALRRSRAGTAPGLDTIPLELYRKAPQPLTQLLARVFSAIGATGELPPGFHDGLITVLHKSGDRADPANYRPITLLNTDYRLLAKVLVHRLAPHLPKVIGPEQTAFIKGRSIGDSIHLLQLLPHMLAREKRWALAVFCDFRKAYDTVDRAFLLSILERLGAGAGFLAWLRLLLSNTRASALVNGSISNPELFHAGVRQGCPLAPLLYLFVGLALLCLLKARGVGVVAGGQHHPCTQFADDCTPFLQGGSLQELQERVAAFLAAMHTFQAASGQELNPIKTKLLPIGATHPFTLPASIHGLAVVSHASTLGITFNHGTQTPTADWPALRDKVQQSFSRLARLQLSAFGRGFASAAYGTSKLLFHCEYVGLPPNTLMADLDTWTAKLVDGGRSPQCSNRRFAGVKGQLLAAPPASGGFGALPWREHIRARHAVWGVRLITAGMPQQGRSRSPATADASQQHSTPAASSHAVATDGSQPGSPRDSQPGPLGAPEVAPWVAVARHLLRKIHPAFNPSHLLLLPPNHLWAVHLPDPLRRMQLGLCALPRVGLVKPPPQPGSWCCEVPIWGNPLLEPLNGGSLADSFPDAANTLHSGRILELEHGQAHTHLFPPLALNPTLHPFRQQLSTLLGIVIPAEWRAAAWRCGGEVSRAGGPVHMDCWLAQHPALAALGWQHPAGTSTPLPDLTVRLGTRLQLEQPGQPGQPTAEEQRRERLATFAALAGAPTNAAAAPQPTRPAETTHQTQPPEAQAHADQVLRMLARIWKLNWDNSHKEVLWRLAVNGLPLASRMRGGGPKPCSCGHATPDRRHHFWECPVAVAVVDSMQAQLGVRRNITCRNLWLAEPPANVHAGMWDVVCLAALVAMDSGRRLMTRIILTAREQNSQLTPGLTQHAAQHAVARFWDLLQDFCTVGLAPATWQAQLSGEHPFFCWQPVAMEWQVMYK